jgi:hypothetical protein
MDYKKKGNVGANFIPPRILRNLSGFFKRVLKSERQQVIKRTTSQFTGQIYTQFSKIQHFGC